jgi:hypothetical protein
VVGREGGRKEGKEGRECEEKSQFYISRSKAKHSA